MHTPLEIIISPPSRRASFFATCPGRNAVTAQGAARSTAVSPTLEAAPVLRGIVLLAQGGEVVAGGLEAAVRWTRADPTTGKTTEGGPEAAAVRVREAIRVSMTT